MSGDDVINQIVNHIEAKKRPKLSIGVLTSGNGANLQSLIDFSKNKEAYFVITSVISNNKNSKAFLRANQHGIPNDFIDHHAYKNRAEFEDRLHTKLLQNGVELVVLAGFLRVLSVHFLESYECRVINLHPSLLPKHKGLHAIEKALLAKDFETGCTVHLVDSGLDTGPIIAQSACPILASDDLPTLVKRIQKLELQLLPTVVNKIAKMVVIRDFV